MIEECHRLPVVTSDAGLRNFVDRVDDFQKDFWGKLKKIGDFPVAL